MVVRLAHRGKREASAHVRERKSDALAVFGAGFLLFELSVRVLISHDAIILLSLVNLQVLLALPYIKYSGRARAEPSGRHR